MGKRARIDAQQERWLNQHFEAGVVEVNALKAAFEDQFQLELTKQFYHNRISRWRRERGLLIMGGARLTEEQRDWVIDQIESNVDRISIMQEFAEKFGRSINKSTVSNIKAQHARDMSIEEVDPQPVQHLKGILADLISHMKKNAIQKIDVYCTGICEVTKSQRLTISPDAHKPPHGARSSAVGGGVDLPREANGAYTNGSGQYA